MADDRCVVPGRREDSTKIAQTNAAVQYIMGGGSDKT
jgi:hypothetical protein